MKKIQLKPGKINQNAKSKVVGEGEESDPAFSKQTVMAYKTGCSGSFWSNANSV